MTQAPGYIDFAPKSIAHSVTFPHFPTLTLFTFHFYLLKT